MQQRRVLGALEITLRNKNVQKQTSPVTKLVSLNAKTIIAINITTNEKSSRTFEINILPRCAKNPAAIGQLKSQYTSETQYHAVHEAAENELVTPELKEKRGGAKETAVNLHRPV